jgi:DNA replicative helicase MCM subunit Mcm2 (Cdc46/Mcm family)
MATLASGKLSEMFEDFLKSVNDRKGNPVYRGKISQLISSEGKSLVVEFGDLLRYNNDLANRLLLEPDSSLESFRIAAFETMRSENALYADRVKRDLTVRLRGIPDLVPLRKVDTSFIDRMLAVSGMVVRSSELRPLMIEGAWLCPSGHLTYQEQDDLALKRPPKCELCGEVRNFELDKRHSRFIDFQVMRVQELPEELPPGQLPQFFDVNVEGDIVNTARPGDRVVLTGVIRAVPDYTTGQVRTRLFRSQIDCNHIEVKGKEPDQVQVTKEDEELIKKVATAPDAYERLVSSIAPVILGHRAEKEAILLLLAGGSATVLPDGTKLRGDINALFVGDPGCLVADERIVLGNGAVAKIGEVGKAHLQPLNLQVLTGEGGGKRAVAKRFHVYRRQPILEIVTESGKSIKGTYNHPLLVISDEDGRPVRVWKRLDEMEVGDRVAATTFIPCTITGYRRTGFKTFQARYGPGFRGRLPSEVDEDLAGYLGYLLGGGFVDRYSAVVTVAEPEIDLLPKLEGMMARLFGLVPRKTNRLRVDRNVPTTDLYLSSECVAANLAFLRENRVPSLIFASGNRVVSAFLRWLFEADGTVFSKGRGRRAIELKAKDVELLRDVQILLLRWGIHSRIARNALLIRRGEDIVKFAEHIGFVSQKKSSKLSLLAEEARRFGRVHKQLSERVVRVYRRQPEDVYDIEVPEGNRFIANGLISHNTGKSELLKFASQVAPRGLYASGRGTTAAGLSAAVIREKNVLMLEAGVVVLADLGIAAIDEFEKMKPEDRTALHEMMEQQSYHPLNEIMLADGAKARIGDLVDGIFNANHHGIVAGKDCEVVPLAGEMKVMSVGPGGRNFVVDVDRVSRHKAPRQFIRIEYSNGRWVTVTPEHPVFVYRGDRIRTIPAAEVTEGDFAPAPTRTEAQNLSYELAEVESSPRAKAVLQQKTMTPDLGRVLGYLITEGNFYHGRTTEVNLANYDAVILADMQASADRLFGFPPTPGYRNGKQITIRYLSKTLLDLLEANFPEMVRLARNKRVPKAILGGPANVAREFLATAYLGDGSVESEAVCYRTASPGLAEDYQDLLLSLGISSRINFDRSNNSYKVYVTSDSLRLFFDAVVEEFDPRYEKIKAFVERSANHKRSHDMFPTELVEDLVNLRERLGLPYDGRYWEHEKYGYGITRESLVADLATLDHRLGEVTQAVAGPRSPREVRELAGWSQEYLAGLSGLTRRVIDYLERGGYPRETRKTLEERVKASVEAELQFVRGRLSELHRLTSFRFLRVRSVRKVANSGRWKTSWVYDVTVEPTHNFVSNGLILHNTVTIAKAGIYATLNARTAILAACNPVLGRYNPFQNLTENIGTLPIPLLTRFDVIFVFRDQPSPAEDEQLATHILAVHARKSYTTPPPIEFSLLKKYLTYVKRISPTLTKGAVDRLREYYLELRRSGGAEDSIPPTPRTLEAMIRIATARARVLLRDEVTEEDALTAIALMNRMVEDVLTDATTKKTDFGIQLGKPVGERKNLATALEVMKTLEGGEKKPVERKLFKEELMKAKFSDEDAEKMIRTMFREGVVYESKPGFIRRLGG